jgi:hypothetical protein
MRRHLMHMICCLCAGTATASEVNHAAERIQNPMADAIKIPLENQFDQNVGHKGATQYTFGLKPSMASGAAPGWIGIHRLNIPFIYQPGLVSGEKDSFGLGDIQYESFYGPAGLHTFYWGIGPLFEVPTATDNQLGSRKWSAGLGGTGSIVKGPLVAGARVNHLWSFAGSGSYHVRRSTIEYFAYLNFAHGWFIGTSPVNVADWEANSDDRWIVPIGGGIGKVFANDRHATVFKLDGYHYAEKPASGAEWLLLFEIQFLFDEGSFIEQNQ